ncbi:hypothetical protein D3C76_353040 [compost metagenome]
MHYALIRWRRSRVYGTALCTRSGRNRTMHPSGGGDREYTELCYVHGAAETALCTHLVEEIESIRNCAMYTERQKPHYAPIWWRRSRVYGTVLCTRSGRNRTMHPSGGGDREYTELCYVHGAAETTLCLNRCRRSRVRRGCHAKPAHATARPQPNHLAPGPGHYAYFSPCLAVAMR